MRSPRFILFVSVLFILAAHAQALPSLTLRVKATAVGVYMTLNFPTSYLESKLPAGLALIPNRMKSNGTYPVKAFFGAQMAYKASTNYGGGIQVEGVHSGDTFMVRTLGVDGKEYDFAMHADVGNEKVHEFEKHVLGWDKNMAFANWDNTDYTASELDLTRLYRAEFKSSSKYDKSVFRSNLAMFEDDMTVPIIVAKSNGKFYCFNQYWGWSAEDNRFRPVKAKVKISKAAFDGVMAGTHDVTALDSSVEGAFKMVMPWKMVEQRRCNGQEN